MKVSTASLTLNLIEQWKAKGYVVEAEADEEFANVHLPEFSEEFVVCL